MSLFNIKNTLNTSILNKSMLLSRYMWILIFDIFSDCISVCVCVCGGGGVRARAYGIRDVRIRNPASIRNRHIAAEISRPCNKAQRKMSKLETETKREVHNVRVSYVTINCTRRQTLISPMALPRYEITPT